MQGSFIVTSDLATPSSESDTVAPILLKSCNECNLYLQNREGFIPKTSSKGVKSAGSSTTWVHQVLWDIRFHSLAQPTP